MDSSDEPSHDVALAIAIVMAENGCDAESAAKLITDRARALGVTFDETAATIVALGPGTQDSHEHDLRDWLHRRPPAT